MKSILDEARKITSKDRFDEYGPPKDIFNMISDLWSAYLGRRLSAKDVSMMMVLFKIAREKKNHKRDNLVDAIGYLRIAANIEGIEEF